MYVFFDSFFLCFLGIGKGANVLREAEAEAEAEAGGVAGNKAVMVEDEGGESLYEESAHAHGG